LQVVPVGTFFQRTLQPRVANALYSGAFTSFGQVKNQWVDMASQTVQHYGLKYGIFAATTAATIYSTVIEVVYQVKQLR